MKVKNMEVQLNPELMTLKIRVSRQTPPPPSHSNLVQRLLLSREHFQLQQLKTHYEIQLRAFQSPRGFDSLNLGLLNGVVTLGNIFVGNLRCISPSSTLLIWNNGQNYL